MRTLKPCCAALLLLATLGPAAAAQRQGWYTALTWQGSFPGGDTKDFTGDFSWRGIGLDTRKFLKSNIAVGLTLGWNVFNEETDEVISALGVDVSGDQFRYVNAFPILGNATFVAGQPGRARPFGGLGVGAYIIERRLEVGQFGFQDTNVHFGLAPEAGVAMALREDIAGIFMVRYNYAFSAGGSGDQSWLGLNLGVAWAPDM